jgi:uncharacterized protein YecT (DUF1311 family)
MRKLLPLVLLICSCSALAIDCSNAVTTPDMNECASLNQKKVEAKLNQVYQKVMKDLDKPDSEGEKYSEYRKTLLEAQRAWIKFRDADCNAIYTYYESGSIRNLMAISCKQKHAERRIKDLEEYLGK